MISSYIEVPSQALMYGILHSFLSFFPLFICKLMILLKKVDAYHISLNQTFKHLEFLYIEVLIDRKGVFYTFIVVVKYLLWFF